MSGPVFLTWDAPPATITLPLAFCPPLGRPPPAWPLSLPWRHTPPAGVTPAAAIGSGTAWNVPHRFLSPAPVLRCLCRLPLELTRVDSTCLNTNSSSSPRPPVSQHILLWWLNPRSVCACSRILDATLCPCLHVSLAPPHRGDLLKASQLRPSSATHLHHWAGPSDQCLGPGPLQSLQPEHTRLETRI